MIKNFSVLLCVIFLTLAGTRYIYAQEAVPQPEVSEINPEDANIQNDKDAAYSESKRLHKKSGFFIALDGGIMLLVEHGTFFGDAVIHTDEGKIIADPNPLVFPFDFSVGFLVAGNNFLDIYVLPSLAIYWTNYIWDDEVERPLPAAIENRSEFVMGFFTGVDAEIQLPIGKSFLFFADVGFAADMRLVMFAADINENDKEEISDDVDKVKDYFWDFASLRPFYFHAALGVGMRHANDYSIAVNLNMWLPFVPPPRRDGDIALLGARFGLGVRLSKDFKKNTTTR
jgi:hypothetical protein